MSRGDDHRRRFPPWAIAVCVVAALAVGTGTGYILSATGSTGGSPLAGGASTSPSPSPSPIPPLQVVSSVPADGATSVASDATINIQLSTPVTLGSVQPTLSPAVPGTWSQATNTSIEFVPSAALVPSTHEVVTIPGGPGGFAGNNGAFLASDVTVAFTVANGDVLRLQQLLAQLNYLPLSFAPTGPPPAVTETASAQPGTFNWLWPTLPAALTSQWTPGSLNPITQGAVMTFEQHNGLQPDGEAGPSVWNALLKDTAAGTANTAPYNYVLVNKVVPESLTVYSNGVTATATSSVPVNTGLHGADTPDGTYPVFEHVTASEMKGTNPNGSKYDDKNVPWASYFHGGDALHGFVRATYGFPQSNGCVEMAIANAAVVWPMTPVGTLVTVVGPSS